LVINACLTFCTRARQCGELSGCTSIKVGRNELSRDGYPTMGETGHVLGRSEVVVFAAAGYVGMHAG
jgi:hypothetical protein